VVNFSSKDTKSTKVDTLIIVSLGVTSARGATPYRAEPQSVHAFVVNYSSSNFRTAMKASWGISTFPTIFRRFLPFFCFSSSFFLRVMSPP
jgi:hypothetical protein